MTPADTALALLRESRDGALIWHDYGATVTRLAQEAGGDGDLRACEPERADD